MRILYVGGGFVGACSAAVSADSGHEVLVFDVDKEKVKKLSSSDINIIQSALHEEGLAELLIRNRQRISFTDDQTVLSNFVSAGELEVVFMCLPTPEKNNASGETDLSYYETAATMIGSLLKSRQGGEQTKHVVIINKSTVPIRMIDYTRELFVRQGVKNFGIVSNPEFLVEGRAIKDSIHPDRVVVGALEQVDFEIMRRLYQRFYDSTTVKYIEVNPYEAAAGKLLANYLLFNKVVNTYDVMGRTCEYFPNISYEQVRRIIITEPRIGSWGLYDSLYAGGSCFIKDAASLAHQLEEAGARANLVRGILGANAFQRDHFFGRAETEAKFVWSGATVAVLGVAFKQATNDIRNSGAIDIIHQLIGAGVKAVRVYDPAAMDECKKYFRPEKNDLYSRLVYFPSATEALQGTSAAIICTDWPEFKTLASVFKSAVPAPYLIMDGRRSLQQDFDSLGEVGYDIIAVGSPFKPGKK